MSAASEIIVLVELRELWIGHRIADAADNQRLYDPNGRYDGNAEANGAILVFGREFVVHQDVALGGGGQIGERFDEPDFGAGRFAHAAPELHKVRLLAGQNDGGLDEGAFALVAAAPDRPRLVRVLDDGPARRQRVLVLVEQLVALAALDNPFVRDGLDGEMAHTNRFFFCLFQKVFVLFLQDCSR